MGREILKTKQVPVLINYSIDGKRYEKLPNKKDFLLLDQIQNEEIPYWYPQNEMPKGYNTEQPKRSHGCIYTHHFYTKRNLWILATFWAKIKGPLLRFAFLNTSWHGTLMRRYNPDGGDRPLTGTLYIPSLPTEANLIEVMKHKYKMLKKFLGLI